MVKKKAAWWSGFVGGVAVTAAAACGLHYYQYGTLPFAGDSLVTGSSARKTAAIEKIINEQYLEETDEETLADDKRLSTFHYIDPVRDNCECRGICRRSPWCV